ncbi:MAG: hypothetical protein WC505_07960 [Patescibacteria group bacterium]
MGDGGGTTTSTGTTITKSEPPEYIKPYSVELANRANSLSNRPYQGYGGEQVAALNEYHNAGMSTIANRANGGDATFNAANGQARNTLNGGYLGQGAYGNAMAGVDNKYLNDVINNTNSDVVRAFQNGTMPQTDASFARSGAFGGSAWQQANAENNRQMASELAKNTSNLRMQDYQTQQQLAENMAERQTGAWGAERGNMMGMVGAGQQLSNQVYTDAQNMLGVGDIYRDYQQTLDNQNYQNFLNQQNWPLQNLDILSNAIRTSMGGGGTSTQTGTMPTVNRTASMIGGGMAGAGLGSALGGGGYGTAAGAGLGALAGLLG